jgi:DNA-binding MarR family transcriptional regulator
VYPHPPNHEHDQRILQAIASGQRVTQRGLAGELGVALGLTNLLIRRLVAKGYVRMTHIGTRHMRYLLTPAGWEALAAAAHQSLENTMHLYTQTREQIRVSLSAVSERCPIDPSGEKRIVFYGAGDVAEIAYVSLQRTDLQLVGVVDDTRVGRFFHLQISRLSELTTEAVAGVPYSHIVVTTVRHAAAIRRRLHHVGITADRVTYLGQRPVENDIAS